MNKESIEEKIVERFFSGLDKKLTNWMANYGLLILRISLGIVFFWFGMLKFFEGLSPAEELVRNTVYFVDPDLFLPVLAAWESLIGIGLITGKFLRVTILLLFLQMPGTALPLLILPEKVWTVFPYGLTIEGQYIVKNLVLIGAGLVIGATVRGGGLLSDYKSLLKSNV
ncbi:MAG: DoxX family protein [Ignavibacteriaceae bacterium]|nr:DoxX family protein [Ignavibacteriaceae bacterium]